MTSPLIRFFTWITCSVAIGAALMVLIAPHTATAAENFAVPEPAILLLLGVGLSAIAVRFRSRHGS